MNITAAEMGKPSLLGEALICKQHDQYCRAGKAFFLQEAWIYGSKLLSTFVLRRGLAVVNIKAVGVGKPCFLVEA